MSKLLEALKLVPNTRAGKELSAKNLDRLNSIANRATDTAASAQTIAEELAGWVGEMQGDSGANAATPTERAIVALIPEDFRSAERIGVMIREATDGRAARGKAIEDAVKLRTAIRGAASTEEDQNRYRAKLAKLDFDEITDELSDLSTQRGGQGRATRLIPVVGTNLRDDDDDDSDDDEGEGSNTRSADGLIFIR